MKSKNNKQLEVFGVLICRYMKSMSEMLSPVELLLRRCFCLRSVQFSHSSLLLPISSSTEVNWWRQDWMEHSLELGM